MSKADMTDAMSTALAAIAILLQVLLVLLVLLALAALFSPAARRLLVEIRDTLLGGELWIAWGIAAVATLRHEGWHVIGGPRRTRLGELTLPWEAVAPG